MDDGLRWSLPGRIDVAYSTRADGDQRSAGCRDAFLRRIGCVWPCVVARQIHGCGVVDAYAGSDALAAADGLVSADASLALGSFGADCPGLCLASADAMTVAHCGWRGTALGIVAVAVAALAARTRVAAGDWIAFIGPGISGNAYEVDGPVLAARAWPPGSVTPGRRPGHAYLDLPAVLESDLRGRGITRIERSGICTWHDARLWSYRRSGPGPVQMLVAWRSPEGTRASA